MLTKVLINRVYSIRTYSNVTRNPPQLRRIIWERYVSDPRSAYAECTVCQTEIHITNYEIGHVKSKADGGDYSIDNLRPICTPCNRSMGRENLFEYKRKFFPK
jgi:5-methylcytosine-specific restriction endonuclease McrA